MNKNAWLGFGFLLVCAFLLWLIVPQIWGAYSTLPVGLSAPLTAVAGGLLVAIYKEMMGRSSETRARQREKQVNLYEQLVRTLTSKGTPEDSLKNPDIARVELMQDMMLWASDNVLKHYRDYRQLVLTSKEHDPELVSKERAKTLFAVRKDLEHKNQKMKVDDIHALLDLELGAKNTPPPGRNEPKRAMAESAEIHLHPSAGSDSRKSA